MRTRREPPSPAAGPGALATLPFAAATLRPSAADEGRRLVGAMLDADAGWRRASDLVSAAGGTDAVWGLQDASDDACGAALDAREALLDWVVLVTGHDFPSGSPRDYDVVQTDNWPAAAVLLDGVLWVAYQDGEADPGELRLTHVVMSGVVRV